ncbi:hypothetical protein WEH80_26205 [Actinomycetes bacterium KLBMP 9759]
MTGIRDQGPVQRLDDLRAVPGERLLLPRRSRASTSPLATSISAATFISTLEPGEHPVAMQPHTPSSSVQVAGLGDAGR